MCLCLIDERFVPWFVMRVCVYASMLLRVLVCVVFRLNRCCCGVMLLLFVLCFVNVLNV